MSRTWRLSADRKSLVSAGMADWPYGTVIPPGSARSALSRMRGISVPLPAGNSELERRQALVYGAYQPQTTDVGPYNPAAITTTIGTPTTSVDFNATSNGQVIENLYVWGSINLGSFSNVEVRNCVVRGGLARGTLKSYIQGSGDNLRGAWIHDVEITGRPVIVPATYNGAALAVAGRTDVTNVWWNDAIRGGNYKAERLHITRTVDGFGFTSGLGNVQVLGCWVHRPGYCEWAPQDSALSYVDSGGTTRSGSGYYTNASGYYTHSDCIQTHQGADYLVKGNRLGGTDPVFYAYGTGHTADIIASNEGYYNAGIMLKQEGNGAYVPIERLTIESNWIGGGTCGINFPAGAGNTFATTYIKNNKFARRPSTWTNGTLLILTPMVGGVPTLANNGANISGNVYDDDGSPIPLSKG